MTATDLKKRAIALAEKTKIDSVTPEEVGQLSNDIVEYIENVEINGSSLGIRKTYTSVSAMESDSTAPKDDKGVLLRRGMLVNIYNQEDPDSADNGKVFSFQNPGWAFRGTVDAGYATKEELTELEQQIEDIEPIIINGDVTNNPDDEDIESVIDVETSVGKLKFKDRAYFPSNFSGKGYKILRKNIIGEKNILTQSMISEANTIYEIRYDFDLNGGTLYLVDGVVLNFNGGKLSNGIVHRNNSTSLIINPNFHNIETKGAVSNTGKLKYYSDGIEAEKDASLCLGDIVYLTKRESLSDEGGGLYKVAVAGEYATQGGIQVGSITLNPIKAPYKGVFNMNKYGILPNGEDMSDKLNTLLQTDMQWIFNESTLYFPAGSYKFKKPLNLNKRFIILGDEGSFRIGNDFTGTEFDFSGLENPEGNQIYCINSNTVLKKIKNIHFKSDSYILTENRSSILTGDGTDAWTEVINQQNINCLTSVSYVENCSFDGFSGVCIDMGFVYCNNVGFSHCNICIKPYNDSVITNVYAYCVNNITYGSIALNLISNVRGDSIRDYSFNRISSATKFYNICIDWGYKSVYNLRGDDSVSSKAVRQIIIHTGANRNCINYKLMNKSFMPGDKLYVTDENTSEGIGIVNLPSDVRINELASDISIIGSYFNAKDAGPEDFSNIIPNIGMTINCASNINITGSISITLTDISISELISDLNLFRRYIEIIDDSTLTGLVTINGFRFKLNNLSKGNYNNNTIKLLDVVE